MTREEAIEILYSIDNADEMDEEFAEAYNMAIEALEQTRWIPVSEEEPFLHNPKTAKEAHKGISYITTLSNGNVAITKRKFYISGNVGGRLFGKWEWSTRGKTKVIAWMPLPESYKAESEDKE